MNRVRAGSPRRPPARRRTVVAIGVFDGLHRGHRKILNLVIREARRLNAVPAIVTFDRHPLKTLRPAREPRMIMSLEQRLAALRTAGINRIEVLRFDTRCAAIPADGFLERVLRRRMHPAAVVVGPDFRFGRGGRGTVRTLRAWAFQHGVRVTIVPPLRVRAGSATADLRLAPARRLVSSTLIRRVLERGDVATANRLLARPIEIAGRVIHGAHRGRTWGIPTANLSPDIRYALPPGVYAGRACVLPRVRAGLAPARLWTRAVINIGTRPTASRRTCRGQPSGRPAVVVEVHLLGAARDLYGRRLQVRLLKRLRAERRFSSPEALVRQIRRDIARALSLP